MPHSFTTLKLDDYVEEASQFYVARYIHTHEPTTWALHNQTFAELFWITRGKCRHRLEGGEEILTVGDARFVRPCQPHCLTCMGQTPMEMICIGFPADILSMWELAYPIFQGHFYWTRNGLPGGVKLNAPTLSGLEEQIDQLSLETHDLFFLHRFLLNLFHRALPREEDFRDIPAWLKRGLASISTEDVLQGGVQSFAKACGRSPAHVARECRKHLNESPVKLINSARIKEAARLLRMTDKDVHLIMEDCGHSNPSHFYRLFKQQYSTTPHVYRVQQRRGFHAIS